MCSIVVKILYILLMLAYTLFCLYICTFIPNTVIFNIIVLLLHVPLQVHILFIYVYFYTKCNVFRMLLCCYYMLPCKSMKNWHEDTGSLVKPNQATTSSDKNILVVASNSFWVDEESAFRWLFLRQEVH